MNIIKKILLVFMLAMVVVLPLAAMAQQNSDTGIFGDVCDETATDTCDFYDLMELVNNILRFLVLVSIPLATISFAYAGYLLLTSGGSEEKMSQAKSLMTNVVIGFIFVLGAWLIVRTITSTLLNEDSFEDLMSSTRVEKLLG